MEKPNERKSRNYLCRVESRGGREGGRNGDAKWIPFYPNPFEVQRQRVFFTALF